MKDSSSTISLDSPICQTLCSLPEKFLVDFANGIDVVREQVRVQRTRTNFFTRLYDGFTGQGVRRQVMVNASLADGVEASLQWLGDLSESLAHSNLALAHVNNRIMALTRDMSTLAHYSADTRQKLQSVAHRLDVRMQDMAREIARIDYIQKAQLNLDVAFDKWAGGRFAMLAPAARCYAMLEELRWGALGDFCRIHRDERESRDFMGMVADRAAQQLTADARLQSATAVDMRAVWLAEPQIRGGSADMRQALAYLADGMSVERAPFIHSATQIAGIPEKLPLQVPLIAAPRRVAEAMLREVFWGEINHAI